MAITHLCYGDDHNSSNNSSSATPILDVWVDPDCVAGNGSRSKLDQAMEDQAQIMMVKKKSVQEICNSDRDLFRQRKSTATARFDSAEDKENVDPCAGKVYPDRRSLILMPDRPLPRKPLEDITALMETSQVNNSTSICKKTQQDVSALVQSLQDLQLQNQRLNIMRGNLPSIHNSQAGSQSLRMRFR